MIEPLRLSEHVSCSQSHAFRTWTERFGTWWPASHTVSGDPAAVVLESRLGGRIYERSADGSEIDWGEVTRWEPPDRLGYLWHIRRERSQATEVEIAFVALDDAATRIDIIHGGWEALGPDAQSWRDVNRAGWGGLLPHFRTACLAQPGLDEGASR